MKHFVLELRSRSVCYLLPLFCLLYVHPLPAQQMQGPQVFREVRRGVTPPVRSMSSVPASARASQHGQWEAEHPPYLTTLTGLDHDSALQAPTSQALTVTRGLNFDGVPGSGYSTSDSNGSVGATQYVQYVNARFAIYDKTTGLKLKGPVAEATLWQTLGPPCSTSSDGDISIVYDKAAARWVFMHHAMLSGLYYECIAVSKTSDATGAYNLYAFQLSNVFPDYPKMGVWPDAYYITANLFNPNNTFLATQVCALDRKKMIAGSAATAVCFQTSAFDSLLPADLDGPTPPPTGAPNLLLSLGSSNLNLFKFHVNFAIPANSTFTGPAQIPVASYSKACGGFACVPQLDTSQVLDSLGDRLMFRVAYRNFGTYDLLTVTHSVTAGASTGLRWYEIRNPRGVPVVRQQGTFAPDATYRWMGSIAMDKIGDMAIGYSASSATQHPAIRFTGRVPADTLGTMESEINVITGTGSEQAPNFQWGDHTSMSLDPIDDCTFWYTNQYYKTDSLESWSTRIVSFKFPACQ